MPTRSQVAELSCRDCESTLTPSDRFCPACGTPNAQSKFHPKFGPGVKRFEPEIVSDLAEPGAPSCPRCHRLMQRPDEFCSACGMDLGPAWERYERVHILHLWRQDNRWTMARYQSTRGIGAAVQVVLFLGIAVAVAVGVLDTWLLARSSDLLLQGPGTASLLQARNAAELVAAGLVVFGGVLLLSWMRRAYANLPALAVGDLRFAPRWVVWGWFVPVINLFRPKQIMDDLWRASHPLAPPFSSSWREGPGPFWGHVWWWGLLLGAAIGLAGHDLIASNAARAVSEPADIQVGLGVSGLSAFLLAVAALALLVLIQQIADRQDDRAELIRTETPDAYAAEVERDRLASTLRGSTAPVFGAPMATVLVHQNEDQGLYGRY
jgi:RNA polymerase subunit RPABC4/transcription elongation factor Spt4